MTRGLRSKGRSAARLARQQLARWDQRRLEALGRSPVVVFSWSKTGSSTVYETLRRAGLGRPVYHVHELDDELEARLERNRVAGRNLGLGAEELRQHRRLRAAATDGRTRFDLVTLVRDPVSRAVSSFFQSYQRSHENWMHRDLGEDPVATLVHRLHEDLPKLIRSTDSWFDRQLAPVFGIDAFSYPFDPERGWAALSKGCARLAIIRLDRLDEVVADALEPLLDVRIQSLRTTNVGTDKVRSDERRTVLDRFRLTEAEIDLALETRTMQHFFSADERERLLRSWRSAV